MSFVFAVAGKGGTGKTTICALLIKLLLEAELTPVLALDADPNSNLNELLGLEIGLTVGDIREEIRSSLDSIPAGMTKKSYMELKLQEILVESRGFDLLVMGRPEGKGCYCYVNTVFREFADILVGNYRFVVMDNEAGLEHLSRMTTRDVDCLLIVSDPTKRGLEAALRISRLADSLKVGVETKGLIINRAAPEQARLAYARYASKELELLGSIPEDELILQLEESERPLLELPRYSFALQRLSDIIYQVFSRANNKSINELAFELAKWSKAPQRE